MLTGGQAAGRSRVSSLPVSWGLVVPAIRHLNIENFRGFERFAAALRGHAVLVGEPGAGRSDLIEALVRVLDPESLRGRRATELDVHNLDTTRVALVEVTIGDLSPGVRSALFDKLEFWDRVAERVVTTLPAGSAPDPDRHEQVVRFAYRLSFDAGQPAEEVFYPKFADPARSAYPRVPQAERQLVPFFWQRGMTTKPLDLGGRGELRELIDSQAGEEFPAAIDRFMQAVEAAAEDFSSQDRVAAALSAVLSPLRGVRRFDEETPASHLIRFLPDGGAPSGLLRSLAAAITLLDSPQHLPAVRHGSTLMAALRGGALVAAVTGSERAIVAVDDLGGEFDPFLARHLAAELRRSAGQLVAATHAPDVTRAFATEEVLRLYRRAGTREVARGRRPATRAERISGRYLTSSLIDAFNASALIVVEGHHDRLGYAAVVERAVAAGLMASYAAAGITFQEAEGSGEAAKVAAAAKELGIFTIVILDNDTGAAAADDPTVQACLAAADAVVRLPARIELEDALLDGVPEPELVRVFTALDAAFGDLALPANWAAETGANLMGILRRTLHDRPGALHPSYVHELELANLPARAIEVVRRTYGVAKTRATGLVEL